VPLNRRSRARAGGAVEEQARVRSEHAAAVLLGVGADGRADGPRATGPVEDERGGHGGRGRVGRARRRVGSEVAPDGVQRLADGHWCE
jgi:hypothetical protein